MKWRLPKGWIYMLKILTFQHFKKVKIFWRKFWLDKNSSKRNYVQCTKDLFSPWILFQRHDGIYFRKSHVCKMFSLRPNVKSQFWLHFVLFFYANRRTIFAYLHSEKRSFHFCKKQRRALLCLWEGTSIFSLPNS